MPRSRSTIRGAWLCVPTEVSKDLDKEFGPAAWRDVPGYDWRRTPVRVTMIPENREGGCLLGLGRGEPINDGRPAQNAIVTAARRAVGKWLNTTPPRGVYETKSMFEKRMNEKARRIEEFERVGRAALGGGGEWVRPLADSGNKKPRAVATGRGGGQGRGGFRSREYYKLRLGEIEVLVGRTSMYGQLIEGWSPEASPPAQWDISANFVRVSEPIGATLEARLRELEKKTNNPATRIYITALRAYATNNTNENWIRIQSEYSRKVSELRGAGSNRSPKIKGKKFADAISHTRPTPINERRMVDGWWVADKKR